MKKLISLIVICCTALLIITGCSAGREYIYPDGLLALQDETPEMVVEGRKKVSEYYPEKEYGKVYINSDGKLCYQLTEKQRENWLARTKDSLEVLLSEEFQAFELSDDLREMSIICPPLSEMDDETREQSIRFFASGVLNVQFFSGNDQELGLKLVVMNERYQVMDTYIYNNETGELERKNVENDS